MAQRNAETPTHDEVSAAVAAVADTELASLTESPDSYVLVPVDVASAQHHEFFQLTPLETSHPTGVLLARSVLDGTLVVTSGHPQSVWQVLNADPGLAEANTIVQLLSPMFDTTAYVGPGSTPAVTRTEHGWRCDLRVREHPGGDVERWRVELSDSPSWRID